VAPLKLWLLWVTDSSETISTDHCNTMRTAGPRFNAVGKLLCCTDSGINDKPALSHGSAQLSCYLHFHCASIRC
jgi:hypothetical protein